MSSLANQTIFLLLLATVSCTPKGSALGVPAGTQAGGVDLWLFTEHDRSGGGFHAVTQQLELRSLRERIVEWLTTEQIVIESASSGGRRGHIAKYENPYRVVQDQLHGEIALKVFIDGFAFGNLVLRSTQVAQDLFGILDRQSRAGLVAECQIVRLLDDKELASFRVEVESTRSNYPRPAFDDLLDTTALEIVKNMLGGR